MAFIRSKTIKGNEYLYLVKSVRNGDSVRQKVLEYLGPKGKVGLECVPTEYRDQLEEEELGTTTDESYLEKTYEIESKQDFREATNKLVEEALSDFGLEERPSEIQLTDVKTYHARFVSSSEDSFHKLRVNWGYYKEYFRENPKKASDMLRHSIYHEIAHLNQRLEQGHTKFNRTHRLILDDEADEMAEEKLGVSTEKVREYESEVTQSINEKKREEEKEHKERLDPTKGQLEYIEKLENLLDVENSKEFDSYAEAEDYIEKLRSQLD